VTAELIAITKPAPWDPAETVVDGFDSPNRLQPTFVDNLRASALDGCAERHLPGDGRLVAMPGLVDSVGQAVSRDIRRLDEVGRPQWVNVAYLRSQLRRWALRQPEVADA